MSQDCVIEISYVDPETYSSIVNHGLRKEILRSLYWLSRQAPVSKQAIADDLNLGYHQISYQLTHHLWEFWEVREERKIRGTRMELISPSHPNSLFITLGRSNAVFVIDPLGNRFGPLSSAGTRCDSCTEEEAVECLEHVRTRCDCSPSLSTAERAILSANGRRQPFRPVDHAIICSLIGLVKGERCQITIPCQKCAFLARRALMRVLPEMP